ncbi:MAG: hydrolase [Peptococcaceae bacterium]|nr:hydrolase [Peptococcaceae bacterium]
MLDREHTVLVVIDVQEKLARTMHAREILFDNLQRLIKGSKVLDVPVLLVEQYPKGLGPTIDEVKELLPGIRPIVKDTFNCCDNDEFVKMLAAFSRKQVLVAGIEAHICVYQTAVGLQDLGYEVQVVADAVSSRALGNKEIGLRKMERYGVDITSVETALFELLRAARGEEFKEILSIIK